MVMTHGMMSACVAGMTLSVLMGYSSAASAVQLTDDLDLTGAIRMRVDEDSSRDLHEIGLDTIMLGLKYDSGNWIGAARYRLYGMDYPYQYYSHVGGLSFMEYAYVGYRFNPDEQLQVGLNQVPIGLQPYFSSTFYETMGNAIGLEDIWQLGVKYIRDADNWNVQAGYYARPAWPGRGSSTGTTYAIVVTPADTGLAGGSNNVERDLVIARLARRFENDGWVGEAGVTALTSTLWNRDSGRDGRRYVYVLHYAVDKGPWGAQLQFARQQMLPKNPGDDSSVTFGGYDGTYNVASRGNLYTIGLSYLFPEKYVGGWVSDVRVYESYSLYEKSERQFHDSQRFTLGTSFSVKFLSVAVEWLNGRNDPYLGGSSYAQSAAAGGTNSWWGQFYINIGYYF
jgi:hypothetical protein